MIRCVLGVLLALFCTACSDGTSPLPSPAEQVQALRTTHPLSDAGATLLVGFLDKNPVRVMTCTEADLTNDGVAEIIVIHSSQVEEGKMTLRVLSRTQAGFTSSNELPAPVENQRITLKNIDNKPPLEFVVMGSKGIRSGFAIYRMVNGVLIDLFDDGMDDCC